MGFLTIAPLLAGLAVLVTGVGLALRRRASAADWMIAAGLCAAFAIYSVYAGVAEGPVGFWVEHTRNLWGVQIWFDLLLAAGVAWYFIVPRARSAGMAVLPWFIVIPLFGSIGLLAVTARVLWLEQKGNVR